MDRINNESPRNISTLTLPIPPPLPPRFVTRSNQSTVSKGHCCVSNNNNIVSSTWDCLFDEGYRADVLILTGDGGILYAHASILGVASPVLKGMLKKSKVGGGRTHPRCIKILGVSHEAVRVFTRFLYSSRYEDKHMNDYALSLLVLSHAYVVPHLKRLCECWLEKRLISTENVIDIFQLALLCDAPRLSLVCHRFICCNFKAVSSSDGWRLMKESHPVLETQILESLIDEDARKKEGMRKWNQRKVYMQLYDAMEALVHICREGSRTIGSHDMIFRDNQTTLGLFL